MAMSPRLLRPRASSALVATDAAAKAYINAVRMADGGQYMEDAVQRAIDAFITGCKADGIWSAIKASCLLMGARTLSGALTPLVGAAPTNNGPFVSGDYNRKTGLVGNGSTKYIDTKRNNNADPQNSKHFSVYVTTAVTAGTGSFPAYIGAGEGNTGAINIGRGQNNGTLYGRNHNSGFSGNIGSGSSTGLIASNRSGSASFVVRASGSEATFTVASQAPFNGNVFVFADNPATATTWGGGRIAFYSVGESLTMSLLDSRVTTLYNAIGAAIP